MDYYLLKQSNKVYLFYLLKDLSEKELGHVF